MTNLAFSGIGLAQMLECVHQLARVIPAAPRRRLHEFADILWKAVAREINPTPRGLQIEINPALKTHYSRQNRTFVVTLFLQQSASDFMPQFVYGGAVAGGTSTFQTTQPSASVQRIEQMRATRAELEAERQMAVESQQQADMLAATETTELHPGGLQQRERILNQAEATEEAQTERVAQLEERVQQMEEAREIVTHDQMTAQERELREDQTQADLSTTQEMAQEAARSAERRREETVEVGDEIRAGQPMEQPTTAPTVESEVGMALEDEEKKEDVAELRLFNEILREQVLPHVELHIVRHPTLMTSAEGDAIVMEVDTNSFRDTRRINVNMPPVIRP